MSFCGNKFDNIKSDCNFLNNHIEFFDTGSGIASSP